MLRTFRRRLVRLHLTGGEPSIEGILVARWAGHYVLRAAKLVEASRTVTLAGDDVRVPRERVLFAQTLRAGDSS